LFFDDKIQATGDVAADENRSGKNVRHCPRHGGGMPQPPSQARESDNFDNTLLSFEIAIDSNARNEQETIVSTFLLSDLELST